MLIRRTQFPDNAPFSVAQPFTAGTALRKVAVIAVDQPEEVVSFYDWLSRNRAGVIGISSNIGCGCCVDMFYLELEDTVESMPCESAGDFDASALRYGQERDIVISTALGHRLGSNQARLAR